MKCEACGEESDGAWKVCPQCGQAGKVVPIPVGVPGTVGLAHANGSDEVRNSKGPAAKPAGADPVAGMPASQIIEGAGG
jgi:hypothetical protein